MGQVELFHIFLLSKFLFLFFSCVIFLCPSFVPKSHSTRHSLCLWTDTRCPVFPLSHSLTTFAGNFLPVLLSKSLCSSPPKGLLAGPISSLSFCSSVVPEHSCG